MPSKGTQYRVIIVSVVFVAMLFIQCAAKPIRPRPYVADFWKNMGWQRYEKLNGLVLPKHHKELRTWIGPRKQPAIRVLESTIDSLEMSSDTTAEATMFIRYFSEVEYLERTTEVTQTWIKVGNSWALQEGFPLRSPFADATPPPMPRRAP